MYKCLFFTFLLFFSVASHPEAYTRNELRKKLSPLQFRVTQEDGTERAFTNEYWANKSEGIYVDVVTGQALFSSKDKFKSGTGWPSFTKSLKKDILNYKTDKTIWSTRTEVRSKSIKGYKGSHLGHVFDDGPAPTGKRYCINSASLKFIAKVDLTGRYKEFAGEFTVNDKKISGEKFLKATFAGGCFWCMEPPFEKQKGVKSVVSGFTGGHVKNPSYKKVVAGGTGHFEAIEITYDPQMISYKKLLDIFWRNIDPTDPNGQFVDQGMTYRSGIFYHSQQQRKTAENSKKTLAKSGIFKKKIVTEIIAVATFYPAEEYHQDYYKKNPIRYSFYRSRSGRDQFLKKVWKD